MGEDVVARIARLSNAYGTETVVTTPDDALSPQWWSPWLTVRIGDFATTRVERVHVYSAIPALRRGCALGGLRGLWRYTQGVSLPWCRIFSAAFTSALASWPQFAHWKTDWLVRLPAVTWPHAEQRWLV